jgi:carboxylate-amine ligase
VTDPEQFTVGVEEEFLLVDPSTRRLVPVAEQLLADVATDEGLYVDHELQLCQVETATAVCHTLAEVRDQIVQLRREVGAAAERVGCRPVSAGTYPLAIGDGSQVTPKSAYLRLADHYRHVVREQVVCGCHVHVGVPDRRAAIEVMNRSRLWLHAILALTGNSPYWNGADTGYASFRTEVWRRWPLAGPPEVFESDAEYDDLLQALQQTGSIDEPARVYWDVRPSARFQTIEFRVADACLRVDDAVLVTGLVRALVYTTYQQSLAGEPSLSPRPELVRAATWRAARYGIDGELVDLQACRSIPAWDAVDQLLGFVRPGLEHFGDAEEIERLVRQIEHSGTGAAAQRAVAGSDGRLEGVVDFLLAQTTPPPD